MIRSMMGRYLGKTKTCLHYGTEERGDLIMTSKVSKGIGSSTWRGHLSLFLARNAGMKEAMNGNRIRKDLMLK